MSNSSKPNTKVGRFRRFLKPIPESDHNVKICTWFTGKEVYLSSLFLEKGNDFIGQRFRGSKVQRFWVLGLGFWTESLGCRIIFRQYSIFNSQCRGLRVTGCGFYIPRVSDWFFFNVQSSIVNRQCRGLRDSGSKGVGFIFGNLQSSIFNRQSQGVAS